MQQLALEARHIYKSFEDQSQPVLSDISFSINKGEFVSVVGKSGCGKSTLLYVLSTMDTAYSGELFLDGECLTGQKALRLARVRNEKIGFVFQFHYLLNEFTVLKNIMLPALKLNKYSARQVEEKAKHWANSMGLEKTLLRMPNQLSGGEKQRVAIARALINDPCIIMCDEPTGNLDKKNSENVFGIFDDLSRHMQQTLLVVTHDPEFAKATRRTIFMEDGKIVG